MCPISSILEAKQDQAYSASRWEKVLQRTHVVIAHCYSIKTFTYCDSKQKNKQETNQTKRQGYQKLLPGTKNKAPWALYDAHEKLDLHFNLSAPCRISCTSINRGGTWVWSEKLSFFSEIQGAWVADNAVLFHLYLGGNFHCLWALYANV